MITPFLPSDPGAPAAPALYDIVDSPVGRLLLTGDEQALTGLYMLDAGSHSATVQPGWTRRPGGFGVAAAQLDEYFAGSRKEFDLPLAPRGTPFQLNVWRALQAIPYGETISYGELARQIHLPGAARAVGLANGANPLPIIVPCHRVIGADGSLTGFGGGLPIKRALLSLEGAACVADLFDAAPVRVRADGTPRRAARGA